MVRTFSQQCRRWGTAHALYAEFMGRLSRVIEVSGVYIRPYSGAQPAAELHASLTMRSTTVEDLEAAVRIRSLQLHQTFVDAALARGDACIAAFDGDRMVAYVWRAPTVAPHKHDLWVTFKPEHEYSYKGFVEPQYRGYRLFHLMIVFSDAESIRLGFTHGISIIETHNFASIRSTALHGNRRIGIAGYVRLLGRTFPFRSSGARRHGFAFRRLEESAVPEKLGADRGRRSSLMR